MRLMGMMLSLVGCAVALTVTILVASVAPTWAGMPAPAPLVGVTGPVGLLAAAIAYGGYLLYKRRRQD